MGLRRATAKKTTISTKLNDILACYNDAEAGTTTIGNEDLYGEPAPHPNVMTRKTWLSEVTAVGPIVYLLQAANCLGGILTTDFAIELDLEVDIDIMTMPYQALAKCVNNTASRARTIAMRKLRPERNDLMEIDKAATHGLSKHMTNADSSFLKTTQTGGGWDKVSITNKTGGISDTTCQYCGHLYMTLAYVIWNCPRFETTRIHIDAGIARLDPDLLPKCMQIGIAPAMNMEQGATYWGATISELSVQNAATLGITDPGPTTAEAKDLFRTRTNKKHNARQCMAHMRADDGTMRMPELPPFVEGTSPQDPNLYSDGGLGNPTKQQFDGGGFGVFWPDANNDHDGDISRDKPTEFTRQPWDSVNTSAFQETTSAPEHSGNNHFMFKDKWLRGVAQWSPMKGSLFSSTRIELAAAIMAALVRKPMHMASDSLSVVTKFNKLIADATRRMKNQATTWWKQRNPHEPTMGDAEGWRSMGVPLASHLHKRTLKPLHLQSKRTCHRKLNGRGHCQSQTQIG